jgi:hypothetical protein
MAHPTVKNVWKGLQREISRAKGKAALTVDHLRTVGAPFGVRRIDVRDRAILLLGVTAAARIPRRARCARCRRGSRRSPAAPLFVSLNRHAPVRLLPQDVAR